jgi:hypothetical protein
MEPTHEPRPIGLHSIIAVAVIVLAVILFLVAFYKPFPTITVINAADAPIEDVQLQTLDADLVARTHQLGTLQVGESREVTVRSYEVTVEGLVFELEDERVEHTSEPLPLTPGQAWRLTVERDGKVIGIYN